MKNYIIIFLTALMPLFGRSQGKYLAVGDKLPDAVITNMHNYKADHIRISDLKGKVFIIDFWAVWCSPCIRALPKLDSLQKEFKDKVFILPVTTQKKELILSTIKRIPSLSALSLPFVTDDTVLRKHFAQIGLPLDIIVDGNGTIRAITDIEDINKKTLSELLQGNNIDVSKRNAPIDTATDGPLFTEDKGEIIQRHFLLSSYINGLISCTIDNRLYGSNAINHFSTTDGWIPDFLRAIVLKRPCSADNLPDNRIRLKVKNTTPFVFPRNATAEERDRFFRGNVFCLDVIVPPTNNSDDLYDYMKTEIENHFHITCQLKKEKVKCFVLTTIDSNLYKTKASLKEHSIFDQGKQKWSFIKSDMNTLVSRINIYSKTPIVDETGFKGLMDIALTTDFNDYNSLRKQLNAYGLELKPAKRKLDIMIIRDK